MYDTYQMLISDIQEEMQIIREYRDDIKKYMEESDMFRGPDGLHGCNYSAERVKTSGQTLSFADAIRKISDIQKVMEKHLEYLRLLQKAKEKMEKLIKGGQNQESQVFYFRFVERLTQKETAKMMGYSERQIQRIEKKIKESEKVT